MAGNKLIKNMNCPYGGRTKYVSQYAFKCTRCKTEFSISNDRGRGVSYCPFCGLPYTSKAYVKNHKKVKEE